MKKLILATLLCGQIFALDIILKDPCANEIKEHISVEILAPIQLSKLLFELFDDYEIPYIGAQNGIRSLFGTSYGDNAFFFEDFRNMRSYGWCYSVDGIQPAVTIDNYTIDPSIHTTIEWVFGRAQMIQGEWVTYCTPVSQLSDLDQGICAE